MKAEPFVRVALAAIDEAGDPTGDRAIVEAALVSAAPLARLARPANARKRVTWAARQLAIAADQPARAYERLGELVAALFEPLATRPTRFDPTAPPRPTLPAPEVAAKMTPAALLDVLAPPPRILSRDIASTAKLDIEALLADPSREQRILGVRSIPQASLGKFSAALAQLITGEDEVLRAEAFAVCARAADSLRSKVVAALAVLLDVEPARRSRALDGMRELEMPLGDERLASLLHDQDARVRVAAARSVIRGRLPAVVDMALIARLADDDADVRAAALGAVIRYPAVHGPALVDPLRTLLQRAEGTVAVRTTTREAIYMLGRLGAIARDAAVDIAVALASSTNPHQAGEALALITCGSAVDDRIIATLHQGLAGPRSDVARAAAMVLEGLGLPVPELSAEARIVRAATEIESSEPEIQRAGLFEAKRLGRAASSLIPVIRSLGERLVAIDTPTARAVLTQVREVLTALGVAADELPRLGSRLESWQGQTPREVEVHGAYVIASIAESAAVSVPSLGVWDNGTGKRLFVVERAALLVFIPGRAEVAALRTSRKPDASGTSPADLAWSFERFDVPSGEPRGAIVVPAPMTYGWPASLAIAGELATVWCGCRRLGMEDAPYRFHVKLGDPDRVIDEVPVLGERPSSRKRTRTDT